MHRSNCSFSLEVTIMHFDESMWKWLGFVIKLIKLFIEIFGDNDEQEIAKNNSKFVESEVKNSKS